MSVEQRNLMAYVFKMVMYLSLSISGFLIVDSYNSVKSDVRDIKTNVENINHRVIRIEYELKLRTE